MRMPTRALSLAFLAVLAVSPAGAADPGHGDETDPARNVTLPCELVSTSTPSRASYKLAHLANVCGIVGTDVELQSRADALGRTHDYAFVGTMGAGFRIFDVTDPSQPKPAGGYVDSGWQNDVQVRGDVVVSTFDGVAGEDSTASTCLKTRYPDARGQGVDVFRLDFNPLTARFEVNLLGCVANPPGGAHNSTLHPGGEWLAISNPSSDWAVDVVDLRPLPASDPVLRFRLIDESRADAARCAAVRCVVVRGPDGSSARGLWRPHDLHFSADGRTAYVAAINATFVVDVSRALEGRVKTIAIIPNAVDGDPANPDNVTISHQADVTADGKLLVVGDERGGGLSNTSCNTELGGVVGALHFYALAEIKGVPASKGASPARPRKLGFYLNPNPAFAPDPFAPTLQLLPRAERGCTVHVFRLGGNGSSSPGPAAPGFDGVSGLSPYRLTTAWYGAGVWMVDFSGPPSSTDGVAEDPRTTWGNTLAFDVMPGADTWSAKEYKGAVYAGDMLRGFDVYAPTGVA